MADIEGKIEELTKELHKAKLQLAEAKEKCLSAIGKKKDVPNMGLALKPKRRLEGHYGKIYAFCWGPNSHNIVSASQDGNMFVWNALYGLKVQGITLESSWVMSCGYSTDGKLVSTAGLDNVVWIYDQKEGATEEVKIELVGHEGYISSCNFMSADKMITTSGDCTAAYWDVVEGKQIQEFTEHTLDVNCAAVYLENSTFVTGSCDATTKLWDVRQQRSVRTFMGHDCDVNAVSFFPDGNAFVTGSDDSTCRLFDIRAYTNINSFVEEKRFSGVTSTAVSKGGRYVFTSYDSGPVYAWDSVHAETVQVMEGHLKRVSRVRVCPDGKAVATGSWDANMMVWA